MDDAASADFHDVLNIPKHSSPDQIRKAYKSLVRKWHPDKHPISSKPLAEAKFKAITQAYEALREESGQRTMFGVYNSFDGGSNGGIGGGGLRAGTPLRRPPSRKIEEKGGPTLPRSTSAMRGSTGFFYPTATTTTSPTTGATQTTMFFQRKPPPIERTLECTLEELFRGCKKEVRYTRDVIGRNGMIFKKEEVQTVKVKPGWKKGTKVTFEEKGDERPGSLPSDVIFLISEKEHPYFKRVGNDLVLKVEVPLVNALTGWSFSLRLLSGEKISCSFRDEIIFPGYEKVIEGGGMPIANQKDARGDLRIKFSIVFPKRLSAEQRSQLTHLLRNCTWSS